MIGRLRSIIGLAMSEEAQALTFWRRVFFAAWLAASFWFYLPGIPELVRDRHSLDEHVHMLLGVAFLGLIPALFFVGIPLRIAINLWFPGRRRSNRVETTWCIATFLVLLWVWHSAKNSPLAFLG